jgi:molecular chaperone GrpE
VSDGPRDGQEPEVTAEGGGPTGPDEETFEVLDVADELAAMADPPAPGSPADLAARAAVPTGDGPVGASPVGASPVGASPVGGSAAGDGPGADGPDDDPLAGDPLAVELAEARQQRDDYLDALRRLQADFENYKKRVARQQADGAERAAESLVDKLLPALDIADLALAHSAGEDVKQVWSALLDPLEREGLERIAPDGGPFDPTRHDAVAHEPGDGDQEVAEVLRAGYAWRGRVLRPAMVKVRG